MTFYIIKHTHAAYSYTYTLTFKSETTFNSYIDGKEIYEGLKIYCRTIPTDFKINKIVKIFIENNPVDVYPYTHVALWRLLTVAVVERSFSKQLINIYLRSTRSQERLFYLEVLTVEKDIASNLKYDNLIDQFNVSKRRNVVL